MYKLFGGFFYAVILLILLDSLYRMRARTDHAQGEMLVNDHSIKGCAVRYLLYFLIHIAP